MKWSKNNETTARHEAGHAVCMWANGLRFDCVRVLKRPNKKRNWAGYVHGDFAQTVPNRKTNAFLVTTLAGVEAEKLYLWRTGCAFRTEGKIRAWNTGEYSDYRGTWRVLRMDHDKARAKAAFRKLQKRARQFVERNEALIEALACALLENGGKMTWDEVDAFLRAQQR